MTTNTREPRVPRLTVRNRRTLGGNGERSIASTVFCPVKERSVGVEACESCDRFEALDFAPHLTSVMCHCERIAPSPAEAARLRDAIGGPIDPETPLADLMTKDVVCVRYDMDVQDLKDLLLERGIGGVPVVDERGKPIGVVSRSDVLKLDNDQDDSPEMERVAVKLEDSDAERLIPDYDLHESAQVMARDVMSPVVLSLHESANIGQAASLMAFEGIHQLPIVSNEGEVVGILSSLDVLRWFGCRSGYLVPKRSLRRQR